MSQAFYADHVITQRQLRTMVLSGFSINLPVVIGLITKKCGQNCSAVLSLMAESNYKNIKRKHQAGLVSFSGGLRIIILYHSQKVK